LSGLVHRAGGQGAASRASFNTATAALRLSISAVIMPTRAASMLALSKGACFRVTEVQCLNFDGSILAHKSKIGCMFITAHLM
jgi:hypothetical protein